MKIGFIGLGNMASAMIGGILKKELYSAEDIIGSDKSEDSVQKRQNIWNTLLQRIISKWHRQQMC